MNLAAATLGISYAISSCPIFRVEASTQSLVGHLLQAYGQGWDHLLQKLDHSSGALETAAMTKGSATLFQSLRWAG
jgi:hypothetical protein